MFRKLLASKKMPGGEKIRWRSHEPLRIEAYSDGVFAFAVSLLIISLDVPKSSGELLKKAMRGVYPFFSSVLAPSFLSGLSSNRYFRRYGLHDNLTIVLNGALLAMVLFSVYPLKFLVFSISDAIGHRHEYSLKVEDFYALILVYNGGVAGIFSLLALMYCNAYFRRKELNLTPVEIFDTKSHLYSHLFPASVAVFVILVATFGGKYRYISMAGWNLMATLWIFDFVRSRIFRRKFGDIPVEEPQLGGDE